jgi:hypothetical protein
MMDKNDIDAATRNRERIKQSGNQSVDKDRAQRVA